jgi:hypothetical protein
VLNGGTTTTLKKHFDAIYSVYWCSHFNEVDLNNALTAIALIVDEDGTTPRDKFIKGYLNSLDLA